MGRHSEHSEIDVLIHQLRQVAARYFEHRGQALGITNEIGELEASRRLSLRLVDGARHDAHDGHGARLCIRTRVIRNPDKFDTICINGLRFDTPWEAALIVLLEDQLEALSIYRACRQELETAIRENRFRKAKHQQAFAIKTIVRCSGLVWSSKMHRENRCAIQ